MTPRLAETLARELRLLVGRARDLAPRQWAAPAGPFAHRADAVHHLAAELARASGAPVPLPRLDSPAVLPDQLAVVGHELLDAGLADAALAAALAEVLLHRYDVDGIRPGTAAARSVLEVLAPDRGVAEFLDVARARCSGASTAGCGGSEVP